MVRRGPAASRRLFGDVAGVSGVEVQASAQVAASLAARLLPAMAQVADAVLAYCAATAQHRDCVRFCWTNESCLSKSLP